MNREKLRLVIADDEESMRRGLSELFPWEETGYTLAGIFSDGRDALAFIETCGADVLLTDIRMPRMDGIALAQAIRERKLQTVIIFLSAYSDFEYARQGLSCGGRDYIIKPVQYDDLIARFRALREELVFQKKDGESEKGAELAAEKMQHYLESNFKNASLEEAAAAAGLSPDYASRIFHKYSGESFADYLHSVKMRQAQKWLCRIDISIKEVADRLGYDAPQNFSRAFHRYYGVKPGDFRRQGNRD